MSETMNADDFCAFMMPYFSPMAFFGFGDDTNGFYSVFSRVFSEILAKERYV
jgi:singapore isolate B (sub-type 7) whole genome shotgun sequence assembly, scaffold_1